jgi:predicted ferric reductase
MVDQILKYKFMNNLLYIVAVILIIGWLLGYFAFHAGGIIHVLLVIAVIVILLRIIQGKKIM